MKLLIRNGDVITAEQRRQADLLIDGEKIVRIAPSIEADEDTRVIDATGNLVFPGFIDPHVHIYLPASGTFAKDNYETAGKAAVLGGTTCFIEFILPEPGQSPLEAWATWSKQAEGHAACDYSFHVAITRYNQRIEQELREMVAQGITSFKVHLAYKDALGLTDEELFRSLGLARELGVMTMAHCENADAIELLRAQLLAEGKTGPEWHYHSRPPLLEADGTHHFLTFAALQEAPAYIAHLSCKESLDVALAAKQRGQSVWIETLIQFLLLDKTYAEKPDFEGAKYVMSPPLRDAANQAPLWDALEEGLISTLSTDHAPFDFKGQKEAGRNDFTRIPSGLPGIQDRATLLYTYGVEKNRIDIHRFVEAVSTQPAKLFGLYPRKGTIAEGSDADVVIFDPGTEQVISASEHAMNVDYNAFEGWPIKGKPVFVTVRGVPVVEEGSFVGHFGYGSFIKRSQPLI